MVNYSYKTIWQKTRSWILQIIDTTYRVGVCLLYHSKVVAVFAIFVVVVFVSSLGFFISIFMTQKTGKDIQGFYTINVGQGDSLLYVTKKNQTFLIDTGRPGDGIVSKLENILGKYKKKIDVVLLTHPDSDHVGEINNILASYNIGMILYSPIYNSRPDAEKSLSVIKDKMSDKLTLPVFAGENLVFSENEKVYFLSPSYSGMTSLINKKDIKEDNYFSVITFIKNKDAIFSMADAPQKIEKVLSSSFNNSDTSTGASSGAYTSGLLNNLSAITGENYDRNNFDKIILKVGHHGSKTSSAESFIQNLSPTDAVLSYGFNNRYGHPNQEALDILNSVPKIKIHRTISGTVYFNE